MTTKLRNGQLLEEFCKAWQQQAEDLLDFARRQHQEITELSVRLQRETDRADYWRARAIRADYWHARAIEAERAGASRPATTP